MKTPREIAEELHADEPYAWQYVRAGMLEALGAAQVAIRDSLQRAMVASAYVDKLIAEVEASQ